MNLIIKHKEFYNMKCYNCETELIWGGDHDCEEHEDHAIVTNLSCPECDAFHLVYWGHKGEEENKQLWIEGYKDWLHKKELDTDDKMWYHYCDVEKSEMEIGKGEECSWCGANESSS